MKTPLSRYRCLWPVLFAGGWLLLVVLACTAHAVNMTVEGTPWYVCPSSTPRPTDMMPPPDPPIFPPAFAATVDYGFVDPNRSVVTVQYMAQNVGWVRISYSGTFASGEPWSGSNGLQSIAYTGNWAGYSSVYPVAIPADVASALISLSSDGGGTSFAIVRNGVPTSSGANGAPCCLPAPIYRTPRPTYTPYPTPTLFKMTTDYFLDDPIYNDVGPVRLRLRLKSPIVHGSFPIFPIFTAATWNLEITNVGSTEFDFLGGLQTYVNEVEWIGQIRPGVWSPSHEAAQFLGIVEQAYYPRAIMPGETASVKVAAWIPATARVTKVSLVLDTYHAGDPGYATFVPGSGKGRLATWQNNVNTICKGEIRYP
jgi:hypothetical protein